MKCNYCCFSVVFLYNTLPIAVIDVYGFGTCSPSHGSMDFQYVAMDKDREEPSPLYFCSQRISTAFCFTSEIIKQIKGALFAIKRLHTNHSPCKATIVKSTRCQIHSPKKWNRSGVYQPSHSTFGVWKLEHVLSVHLKFLLMAIEPLKAFLETVDNFWIWTLFLVHFSVLYFFLLIMNTF